MKLISKFHDYYDTALGHGVDPNVVYVRKTVELLKETYPEDLADNEKWDKITEIIKRFNGQQDLTTFERWFTSWSYHRDDMSFTRGYVGFCGKIYPFLLRFKKDSSKVKLYWSFDKLKLNHPRNKDLPKYREHFNRTLEDDTIFHELDVPVWAKYNDPFDNGSLKTILNPCLKDIHFAAVKDPYSAFQELSMYISGVLGGKSPKMVEISDKEMAAKKGHDGKYSFRKPPEKK
jgi:hypothetical protein